MPKKNYRSWRPRTRKRSTGRGRAPGCPVPCPAACSGRRRTERSSERCRDRGPGQPWAGPWAIPKHFLETEFSFQSQSTNTFCLFAPFKCKADPSWFQFQCRQSSSTLKATFNQVQKEPQSLCQRNTKRCKNI